MLKTVKQKSKDITGLRFSNLVALYPHHKGYHGRWYWVCKCDCGNETIAQASYLIAGRVKSCGCLKRSKLIQRNKDKATHGCTGHPLFNVHKNMISRCNDPNNPNYSNYGKRGISVCEKWLDIRVFIKWGMSSGYSPSLTLERIDVDGNYCPENCTWATPLEQNRNRRNTIKVTLNGITLPLTAWAEKTGISYFTLISREKRGLSPEEILKTSNTRKNV